MKLRLNLKIADEYKSNTQKIRVLSENWVDGQIFCPNCGEIKIISYENNRPVADFYCTNCKEEFELKSKQDSIGSKIVDGAYSTMINRLKCKNNPNFFFLSYSKSEMEVNNFLVIPKHFFIPKIIEKRKPLAPNAHRAGWVGCNILLTSIPEAGRIYYIKDHKTIPKVEVLDNWEKTKFLRNEESNEVKGWLLDIMRIIDKLGKKVFNLNDVYKFEDELRIQYPNNKHVKDKIRQQIQILRDKGYLKFVSRGIYKIL